MKDKQLVFDFDIKNIIYCTFCHTYFNTFNKNDINFHLRIHKKSIKSLIKVGKCVYKYKDTFIYSKNIKNSFETWIKLKINKETKVPFVYTESIDYSSILRTEKYHLIEFIKSKISNLKNDSKT